MSVIPQGDPLPVPDSHRWVVEKCKACINAGPFLIGAPAFGCETHHVGGRSVPCYRELSGCNLACPRCPQRCQWTTYVPLIDCSDPKLKRVVFTGGVKTWNDVRALEVKTVVRLCRGPNQTDTLRVGLWPDELPKLLAPCAADRVQSDITPYLLHLWQLRELTEHFGQRFIRARGRRVVEEPPGRKVPRPTSPAISAITLGLSDHMKLE